MGRVIVTMWVTLVGFIAGPDNDMSWVRVDDEMGAYEDAVVSAADTLLLGRETAGVPDAVHEAADARLRVPMRPGLRSLNVALAAAMVLGEALRQTELLPREPL